jgi:hypothetical protein
MEQKCHGHECNKPVFDNYYCEECFTELQNQKQKTKGKGKAKNKWSKINSQSHVWIIENNFY